MNEKQEDIRPAQQASLAGVRSSATIAVFATMPDGERRHERYPSRDAAARGIRDCRSKGGSDINIFDPWMPKSPNDKLCREAGQKDER